MEEEYKFHTKIVGISFEGRQGYISSLQIGDTLEIKPEPNNVYDPNAIAIFVGDKQLGYLKKELAESLKKELEAGYNYTCVVSDITGATHQTQGVNIELTRHPKSI